MKRPDPRPREKDVQQWVIRLLKLAGFRVRSTSQYRKSGVAEGLPDLMAHHRTRPLFAWFEVKRPKLAGFQLHDLKTWTPEDLRPDQLVFREDALRAGQHHAWGGITECENLLVSMGLGSRLPSGVFQLQASSQKVPA